MLRGLAVNLRARGYEVDTAATGEAALELAELHPPNAVILDLGLPGISGFDVIKDLRGWSDSPIIVLSARSDQADKVHALDVGADDYVTKPFGMDELLARLRAALRRTSVSAAGLIVRTDDFTLDFGAKTARSAHRDVRLTPTEWRIVEVLVAPVSSSQPPSCCSRCKGPDRTDRDSVAHHLGRSGTAQAIPSRPQYFVTEVGLGYRYSRRVAIMDEPIRLDRVLTARQLRLRNVRAPRPVPEVAGYRRCSLGPSSTASSPRGFPRPGHAGVPARGRTGGGGRMPAGRRWARFGIDASRASCLGEHIPVAGPRGSPAREYTDREAAGVK